jgi:hypothetical protein
MDGLDLNVRIAAEQSEQAVVNFQSRKSLMSDKDTRHQGWIGVDLDGTLANYQASRGMDPIGQPIEHMIFRMQQWLDAGVDVRIFTARASEETLVQPVQDWLHAHQLPILPITNRRDFDLLQLWDDRAIQIETNTAKLLTPQKYINLRVTGWIGVELDGVLAECQTGQALDQIGDCIDKMRIRVQQWLMVGVDVRLFTARANLPEQIPLIEKWLAKNRLSEMMITAEKDFSMSQFWDDRAIHVITNTGEVTGQINQFVPEKKFACQ